MAPADSPLVVAPAARPFQGRPAGIVTRVAAASIDFVVVVVILGAIYTGTAAVSFVLSPSRFHWPHNLGWSVPVVYVCIVVPYLALSWCASGRTYGSAVLGIRVVDRAGRRLGVGRSVARAGLCVLFPVGLFWVAFSRDNRSVQDLLLRTSAIYHWAGTGAHAELAVVTPVSSPAQPRTPRR